MITVRFPTGIAVRYNDANYIYHDTESWDIYSNLKENGGHLIACVQFSADALIEFHPPCMVNDPAKEKLNSDCTKEIEKIVHRIDRVAKKLRK